MDINLECSEIMNDDYSQFIDANSQICLNEESFVQTPQHQTSQMTTSHQCSEKVAQGLKNHQRFLSNYSTGQHPNPVHAFSPENQLCDSPHITLHHNPIPQARCHLEEKQQIVQVTDVVLGLPDMSEIQPSTPPEDDSVMIITATPTQRKEGAPASSEFKPQTVTKQTSNNQPLTSNSQNSQHKNQSQATAWQKVTFAKRKPSSNVTNQQQQTTINNSARGQQSSLTQRILQKQKSAKQDDDKKTQRKKIFEDGEPLPVFDCLFCCQEHFVLDKINERSLVNKYANHRISFERSRDAMMINMILKSRYPGSIVEEIIDATPIITDYTKNIRVVNTIPKSLETIQTQCQSIQSYNATVPKLQQMLCLIKQMRSTAHQLPLQQAKPSLQFMNDEDAEESMYEKECQDAFGFIRLIQLQFRTRRQRILHKISFETEHHNIYDPYFTSEDDQESYQSLEDFLKDSLSQDEESPVARSDDQGFSEERSISQEGASGPRDVSVDDEEELKEIVNEYQRSEERKKRLHQDSLSVSPIQNEEDKESSKGNQSISSIEQRSDDDEGHGSFSEDGECLDNGKSTFGASSVVLGPNFKFGVLQSNLLSQIPASFINVTSTLHITNDKSDDKILQQNFIGKADEDEDSERYTFGCVTPKGEGDTVQGQTQHKVTFTNVQGDNSLSPVRPASQTLVENSRKLQDSIDVKGPILIDISPVSCGNNRKSYIGDGASKEQLLNSIVEDEEFKKPKINFYPKMSHIATESIEKDQQTQYEEATSDFFNHQKQQFSKTEDNTSHNQHQQDTTNPFTMLNQQQQLQVQDQYYKNQQSSSKSFTVGQPDLKKMFNHQKLIQDPVTDKQLQKELNLKAQFLMKQEQFQALLQKAKKKTKLTSNGNLQHLQSFDSIQQQFKGKLPVSEESKEFFKQKTQVICTPIDTSDQIVLNHPVAAKEASKTNKTTVNQNSRKQKSALFQGTSTKNIASSSQVNLFSNGDEPQSVFTERKINDFARTKISNKKNEAKPSKTIDKTYNVQTQSKTKSPSILKMAQQNLQIFASATAAKARMSPSRLSAANINQMSQKEMNQFLKSVLLSSRYASTQANAPIGMNNYFKNTQPLATTADLYGTSHQNHQDSVSKSTQKKKKKAKVLKNSGVQEVKKTVKAKKGNKKKAKNLMDQSNQIGVQHSSQQDLQAYINICNSMNFSNDYSIPSIISGGNMNTSKQITQKSVSLNQGHPNNKSSTNAMMYLSMQDGKNLFSVGNNTNIQDTSNNYPYGSSLQAEMSTCISNGCNSNQMTTLLSNQQQLKNNLSTNRGVQRDASQNKKGQNESQKLNGSVEEMNLFYLLSCLGNMKPSIDKSQDSKRQSMTLQKAQPSAFNHTVLDHAQHHQIQDHTSKGHSRHQPQFSFNQHDFIMNQTTDMGKQEGLHKKRKSKGSTTLNQLQLANVTTHSQTVKNTTLQNKRRDNQMRTRSSSKGTIKTDQPMHQLLSNQINFPLQTKNKQILIGQSSLYYNQPSVKDLSKTGIMLGKNHQVKDDLDQRLKNQSRTSNKSTHLASDKASQQFLMGIQNHQKDLNKMYGTGKILMSTVTSPMRQLNGGKEGGWTHQMRQSKDLFQTKSKEAIQKK